jgi:hypothetical protein
LRSERRVGRRRETVELDAVADIGDLAGRTDPGPGHGLLVFAALDQDLMGPGAAPPFEDPAEDVGPAGIAGEIESAMDGVDGPGATEPTGGQSEKRRLGGVGLNQVETPPSEIAEQAEEGGYIGR